MVYIIILLDFSREKYYQYNLRGEYMNIVMKTEFPDLKLIGRGKVRDIYDLDDKLLIVSTDRLSAFDVILPNGIEGKGEVLTELSTFWFDKTSHIVKNHLITTKIEEMPAEVHKYKDILEGRSMLVKKAKPLLAECVVRGYITGSGMKDYLKTGISNDTLLDVYNEQLVITGSNKIYLRKKFLKEIERIAHEKHRIISETLDLKIDYECSFLSGQR